jgi:hypothetical protein
MDYKGRAEGMKSLRRSRLDGSIILKRILKKCSLRLWTRYIRLRIGFSDRLLFTRKRTYRYYKGREM